MTITTTLVSVLRRFEYLAEKSNVLELLDHYSLQYEEENISQIALK
jgi:hypothetical protein